MTENAWRQCMEKHVMDISLLYKTKARAIWQLTCGEGSLIIVSIFVMNSADLLRNLYLQKGPNNVYHKSVFDTNFTSTHRLWVENVCGRHWGEHCHQTRMHQPMSCIWRGENHWGRGLLNPRSAWCNPKSRAPITSSLLSFYHHPKTINVDTRVCVASVKYADCRGSYQRIS